MFHLGLRFAPAPALSKVRMQGVADKGRARRPAHSDTRQPCALRRSLSTAKTATTVGDPSVNQKALSSSTVWGAKHLHDELSALLVDRAAEWTCRNRPNTVGMWLSPRPGNVTGGWRTGPPMTFQGEFLGLSPRRAPLLDGPVMGKLGGRRAPGESSQTRLLRVAPPRGGA